MPYAIELVLFCFFSLSLNFKTFQKIIPIHGCLQDGETRAVSPSQEGLSGVLTSLLPLSESVPVVCRDGALCSRWAGVLALCFHGCGPGSHLLLRPCLALLLGLRVCGCACIEAHLAETPATLQTL